eukprot:g3586.t1
MISMYSLFLFLSAFSLTRNVVADSLHDSVLDYLNAFALQELPTVNKQLIANIPQTYGDCTSKSPPQPCEGSDNLYYVHKKWEYKAIGRWITGLKTINITNLVFAQAKQANFLQNTPAEISLTVSGLFESLPLSLYIGECFTFDQCSILWDNTHGCCGANKHFKISVNAVCGAKGDKNFPIDRLTVGAVTLDKFEITEKIIGIKINVEDITGAVAGAVTSAMKEYLIAKPFLPGKNGTKVTLLQWINAQEIAVDALKVLCAPKLPF